MHELNLIVDLHYEGPQKVINKSVRDTAEYGGYSRGTRVLTETVKKEMNKILEVVGKKLRKMMSWLGTSAKDTELVSAEV